ncbi:MAG: glycosyltransferase [Bacteroidetes bacterium]|nr:glycosyltransferase [Bacteroidota bacterium]
MSKYRFARVTNYYPQYLERFYSHSTYVNHSYEQHYSALIEDSLESASSYTKALNKLQHVEALDIISNANPLQQTWREQHNVPASVSSDFLIIEQLVQFQPDVVWIDDFNLINEELISLFRKRLPNNKLIVGHICAPYGPTIEKKFIHFDLIFSCIPCMVTELREKGFKSHLLYHSFDSEILDKLKSANLEHFPPSQLLFSGSLYAGAGFHNKRVEYLEAFIQKRFPLSLYGNLESATKIGSKKLFRNLIRLLRAFGLGFLIQRISFLKSKEAYGDSPVTGYSKLLRKASHPPIFGLDLFKLMQKAAITFNIHGDIAGNCAGNIRMFEVTGAGSCLLTDDKQNINELFEPGKEIVTYTGLQDCIEKIQWLLSHPNECKQIAQAGQQRTLRDHTVKVRTELLNALIIEELNNKI